MESVCVLVPVLRRPWAAAPFMDAVVDAMLDRPPRSWQVLAICDMGDSDTAKAWMETGAELLAIDFDQARAPGHPWHGTGRPGSFPEKANLGYAWARAWDWLAVVGDDVRFHRGWFGAALAAAGDPPGGQVVGFNDVPGPGRDRLMGGRHALHMLIARAYVDSQGGGWDGPGVLCHEGYWHWYIDDELACAAKQRGVWRFALDGIAEHLHPDSGKAAGDDTYRLGSERSAQDLRLFQERHAAHPDPC